MLQTYPHTLVYWSPTLSTSSYPHARSGLVKISLAGVLWGTGGLAVQIVREHAPLSPLTISAYRTAIATVVLLGSLLALRQGAELRRLATAHPRRVAVVGLATATYQALYFSSVVAVGVTVATVIALGLAPVLLTTVGAARDRAWPRSATLLPVAAALTGLVLVSATSGSGATGPHPGLGVLAALGSGAAYAAATVLGEPLARGYTPLALTTAATAVGAAALVPAALIGVQLEAGAATTADPTAVATLLYLGAATMALAYWLLYAGLRTTSSATAVVATLLEPVAAALVAAVVLGERLGAPGVFGAALILVAVASLGPGVSPSRS
ncbi:DMT family transporter [Dermatophilaceae bacterium Soc4.6]